VPNNSSPDKKKGKPLSKVVEGQTIRDTCQASAIENVSTFAKCESEDQDQCRFTLKFPKARLCTHPLSQEIVARTQKKAK